MRENDQTDGPGSEAAVAVGAPFEIQRRVLELIATGQPLDRVLTELVLGMEAEHPGMRGSLLLLTPEQRFKTGAAPHLPSEYQELVEQLVEVGPSAGSCGTACYRRARVVSRDIATDPLWRDYTEIAARFSLAACWSEPIFSRDGSVLGSFAMYFAEPRLPTVRELESIGVASRLAAIAVDRARADTALRQNEERLSLALAASKMSTWDWDIRTNRVTCSEGIDALFGVLPGTVRNDFAGYIKLVSSEDQGPVRASLDRVLRGDAQDHFVEHRVTWPDGSVHWLECRGQLYRGKDGAPARLVGTLADISERKRTETALHESEAQLRQAQKLEAIGRLAGGVAHDFNNLLTAIGGYSSLALLELPQDHPLREYLEEIQRAGERGASLTKQLLAAGRKQVLTPRLLDLNELIDNLTSLLRRVIGEDVELEWTRGAGAAVVLADPGQVEQVIMNLALNARDAMLQGGTLSISSSVVEMAPGDLRAPAGSFVLLRVADTGLGMDHDTMTHMFEPFFTTKDAGKGTGLGLATVYGIIQQLSGSIRAESVPGRGTQFDIYLPARDEAVHAESPASLVPSPRGGTETVLLVEDESQVRNLVLDVLQARGYRVLSAKDGVEAIPLEESYPGRIDLLITDVVMPGLSGRELARHVLGARPETKVLFISGYTDDALLRHGVNEPGISFLQKPFALDDLLRRVRALLDPG